MSSPIKEHWNKVYSSKPISQLGWHESEPGPSLHLIERCLISKENDVLLDVGSGATTLLLKLLEQGYQHIYALDISEMALEKAKAGLGEKWSAHIHWIVDDVTQPNQLPEVALWHDRAVFHFLTEEAQRQGYLSALVNALTPGGYLVIATFAIGGATKCSGLDVQPYDQKRLVQFFGDHFELLECMNYTYKMPSGDLRPYIYGLFQRRR